jgi:hypothetical protein
MVPAMSFPFSLGFLLFGGEFVAQRVLLLKSCLLLLHVKLLPGITLLPLPGKAA